MICRTVLPGGGPAFIYGPWTRRRPGVAGTGGTSTTLLRYPPAPGPAQIVVPSAARELLPLRPLTPPPAPPPPSYRPPEPSGGAAALAPPPPTIGNDTRNSVRPGSESTSIRPSFRST